MHVFDDELPFPLLNAASWRLAAELVAGIPGSRVENDLMSGGGQYDLLNLSTPTGEVFLAINRNGSLHFHTPEVSSAQAEQFRGPVLWHRCVRPGGAEQVAKEALALAGLKGQPRNRSGHRLQVQVVAHLLTSRSLDETVWDARQPIDEFGQPSLSAPPRSLLNGAPVRQIWMVTAADEVVCWLWEGWAFTPGGERFDLTRRRAAGESLADLAALVTARRPSGNAGRDPQAPPTSCRAEDPTAWLEWAGAYDGYQRLAHSPEELERLLGPARQEFERTRLIPEWCGSDLLRGWLFYLYRADHHAGGYLFDADHPSTLEWEAVYAAWTDQS